MTLFEEERLLCQREVGGKGERYPGCCGFQGNRHGISFFVVGLFGGGVLQKSREYLRDQ